MPQPEKPALALAGRIDALDALRGIAALLIFVFHFFALYPGGQVAQFSAANRVILSYFANGVPLFYALSGLSLYIGFFSHRSEPGFLRKFYLRRFFRIAPLFYAAVAAWYLIFLSRGVVPETDRVLATLSFLFNLLPGYHESFVAAGWSVGVEMLFYAVFPLILARVTSLRASLLSLVAWSAVALVAYNQLAIAFPASTYRGLSILVHCHFFACGIAVYFLAARWLRLSLPERERSRIPSRALMLAIVLITLIVSGWLGRWPLGRDAGVMQVFWAVPIGALLFFACTTQLSRKWLAPFAVLGEWSFSLYLLHPLVLHFVFGYIRKNPASGPPNPGEFVLHFILCLLALVVLSATTFHWIERPAMAWARRLTGGKTASTTEAASRGPAAEGTERILFRRLGLVLGTTWGRGLIATVLATIGFLLPQEIPLEYYPLNNPSSGLQYLEITCSAINRGEVQIFLNTGNGFNELESIRWPIDKSDIPHTYTFPLADAPLIDLRLDPIAGGAGEFTITNFRLLNRREEEILRFTQADMIVGQGIQAIVPLEKGWKIVTTANASDPIIDIPLKRPIIAEGMNERNLKRCLLSWSYLAMMLGIILLAVFFTFCRKRDLGSSLRTVAFLAFICLLFSAVGIRGLIKNSIRYARFASQVDASR